MERCPDGFFLLVRLVTLLLDQSSFSELKIKRKLKECRQQGSVW